MPTLTKFVALFAWMWIQWTAHLEGATAAPGSVWGCFDDTRAYSSDFDLSTGDGFEALRSAIIDAGMTVGPSTSTITAGYLGGVDVFFVGIMKESVTVDLSAAEESDLLPWVENGGILVVLGERNTFQYAAESILNLFSLSLDDSAESYTSIPDAPGHPLTAGVATLLFNGAAHFDVIDHPLAEVIYKDQLSNDPSVVVVPLIAPGNGCVIGTGDSNFLFNNLGDADNTLFMNNLVDFVLADCGAQLGGGASGDPIIYSFDGGWYHFMGQHNQVFALISDQHFQLNSRFIHDEYLPENMTWMGDVGMQIGKDKLMFALGGKKLLNGQELAPSIQYLSDGGKLTIWEEAIAVEIPNYELFITLLTNPLHLNVHVDYEQSNKGIPHGVLGQTADMKLRLQRPDDEAVLNNYINGGALICNGLNAEGCIEGDWKDYIIRSNDIYGSDFTFSKFSASREPFTPKTTGVYAHTLPHEYKQYLFEDFGEGSNVARGGAGQNEPRE